MYFSAKTRPRLHNSIVTESKLKSTWSKATNNHPHQMHNITTILTVGDSHARALTATLRTLVGPNISVTNLWTYGNGDGHYHGCNYFWDVTCTLLMVCARIMSYFLLWGFEIWVYVVLDNCGVELILYGGHGLLLLPCTSSIWTSSMSGKANNYSMWDKFGFGFIQNCATVKGNMPSKSVDKNRQFKLTVKSKLNLPISLNYWTS